jgi:ferric-chelate reductase [NAD(P)H]
VTENLDYKVFNEVSYGLYVVTSIMDDRMNGQIVNTVLQVTSSPPRFAVIINRSNLTHEFISNSLVFAVSILSQEAPMKFVGLFGFKSGRDVDKLSQVNWVKGITGCPTVTDYSLGCMEIRVQSHMDVGTHTIFVGEVADARSLGSGQPMTYDYYHRNLKGKTAKNAPTYNPASQ